MMFKILFFALLLLVSTHAFMYEIICSWKPIQKDLTMLLLITLRHVLKYRQNLE